MGRGGMRPTPPEEPRVLERLTETFIAGVELLEAEGRVARDRVVALAGTLLVLVACAVVGLIGLLAGAVGLTWLLALAIGVGGALALVGATLLLASILVARVAVLRLRRQDAPAPPPARTPSPASPVHPHDPAGDAPQPGHDPEDHAASDAHDATLPAALTRNPPP
jgi:hypothetical protein